MPAIFLLPLSGFKQSRAMPANLFALEPTGNRYRFPVVRGHGPLLQ